MDANGSVDFEKLLKSRAIIARLGEMDSFKWWNTQGLLSRRGEVVLKRGFPNSYCIAQFRVVAEVAKDRCAQVFEGKSPLTLWNLAAHIENQFDEFLISQMQKKEDWLTFFDDISNMQQTEVVQALCNHSLLDERAVEYSKKLKVTKGRQTIELDRSNMVNSDLIQNLAAAFCKSTDGELIVPFAKVK